MAIKLMQKAIAEKTELTKDLNKTLDKIIKLELDLQTKEANMLNTIDWNELFQTDKRVTDKQKNAHIQSILKADKNRLALLKNNVEKIKNTIKLCDDNINLAKYIIREKELTKGD